MAKESRGDSITLFNTISNLLANTNNMYWLPLHRHVFRRPSALGLGRLLRYHLDPRRIRLPYIAVLGGFY